MARMPAEVEQQAAATPAPYVGLRPYDREEADWFYGRTGDAQVLVDKVLSSRLTLLYASSGVGKSSLLKASVMPALENEDCRVVYLDGWSGSDPAADVKDRLAQVAAAAGVVDPLAGAPTLAELARLMTADHKTLVLVFDQFEEFLVNHAQALDPLRKEIAALVRMQAIDARLLLCLREEFLAALEPFRSEILTLFQSTMRLDGLRRDEVLQAITAPAERFGGEVEEALARRLLQDIGSTAAEAAPKSSARPGWRAVLERLRPPALRPALDTLAGPPGRAGAPGDVDLPMMQLICRFMWQKCPVEDGRRRLTLDLYEKTLGGRSRILAEHIRSCMPERRRDRLFTARLMRFLAPRSGMKISYSAADLAELTDLGEQQIDRITAELSRLSAGNVRILHRREFRGDVRYELQHDALVRHIAPWRDEVLLGQRRLVLALRAGAALALVLVVVGLDGLRQRQVTRANTVHRLERLAGMSDEQRQASAGESFGYVVNFLLNQERGASRLDELQRLLKAREALLPADYGMPERAETQALQLSRGSVLTLRYSAQRPLDPDVFQHAWGQMAQRLTRRWGFPVPARVALVADEVLPPGTVRLEAQRRQLLVLQDVEMLEGRSLVDMRPLGGPALEFANRFKSEWVAPARLTGTGWMAVPRWSLPVWRGAGLTIRAESAYAALALEPALNADPGVLMSPEAAYALASQVAESGAPCVAAETWAKGQLEKTLAEWLGGGDTGREPRSLMSPGLLFELLAAGLGPELSKSVQAGELGFMTAVESARSGPWPTARSAAADCQLDAWPQAKLDQLAPYQEARAWLPQPLPKLRVALGADLVKEWNRTVDTSKSADASPLAAAPARSFGSAGIEPGSAAGASAARAGAAATPDDRDRAAMAESPLMLRQAIDALRREVYLANGVWLPDPAAQDASAWLTGADARRIRVALFDGKAAQATAFEVVTGAQAAASLQEGLRKAIPTSARAWIDTETVGRMLRSDSPSREPQLVALQAGWERIALGDLALLMREVLDGSDGRTGKGVPGELASIRDPAWLLTSLVFWKAYYVADASRGVDAHRNVLRSLAAYLRRLQAQRLQMAPGAGTTPAPPSLDAGVAALAEGRFKEAGARFEQALGAGPYEAMAQAFIERYAARWPADIRRRALRACGEPMLGRLSDARLRFELEEVLERKLPGLDPGETRKLWLCLASSPSEHDARPLAPLLLRIAQRNGDPQRWPADQARWLAMRLLRSYRHVDGDPALLSQGWRFLEASLRSAAPDAASATFAELRTICDSPGPMAWCRDLLEKAAQTRTDPWMALDRAITLLDRSRDHELALAWVQKARGAATPARVPAKLRPHFDGYAAVITTYVQSQQQPGSQALRHSGLVDSPAVAADTSFQSWLLTLLLDEMKLGESVDLRAGLELVERKHQLAVGLVAASQPEREPMLDSAAAEALSDKLLLLLRAGELPLLAQALDEASAVLGKLPVQDSARTGLLFSTAVAGLISGHPRADAAARRFIETNHAYVPLVAMLVHWRAGEPQKDAAEQRLKELWARVDRDHWKARLEGGDAAVWYEQLLGMYLGHVPESEVFGPLRDEAAYEASSLAPLGFDRHDVLNEAHFYHALKLARTGDAARANAAMRQVANSGHRRYVEYTMATQLLRAAPDWPVHAAPRAPGR